MVSEPSASDSRHDLCVEPSLSPSGRNSNDRRGEGLEKAYPTWAVRYGLMGYIGEFKCAPDMRFSCGGRVVIQTNRGIEIGEPVSLTGTGCDGTIDRQQMLAYVKNSGPDAYQLRAGRILREAAPQDLQEEMRINADTDKKLAYARELAQERKLPMKFIACEHLFGGERIIFHFMSESRVDFRELVRDLAHDYHTRIEMHQVGARDEARLVADYEICGRQCCCKNFLKKLRPVTMRMAKLQKATLDPSKVSGRCGRLRCCLRFEHEGYEDLNKKLPRLGARIRTDRGTGTVKERQVLTQLLTVAYDDSELVETLGIEELLVADGPEKAPPDGPPSGDKVQSDKDEDGVTEAAAPKAADAAREHEDTKSEKALPSGPERRGRRRRSSRRRSRPKEQSALPADVQDAPTGGHDVAAASVAGEASAPASSAAGAESPSGTEAEPSKRDGRRGRRGRRGKRRRRPQAHKDTSHDSTSTPAGNERERRADSPPKTDDYPSQDSGGETD